MYNRVIKLAMLLAVTPLGTLLVSNASAEEYRLNLNKTEVLHVPYAVGAVIIGNPKIADISVHSQDTFFIMGRGYGETNLIILDTEGRMMMNANIKVGQDMANTDVRVIKIGKGSEHYSCLPDCQPAPSLSDSSKFKGLYQGQAPKIFNATANPVSGASASSSGYMAGSNPAPHVPGTPARDWRP
ncbi:MAG: pilus assembly protein N-terminal domain-containing protein [Robiginitomaculum sp.]